jgi:hypothetical protein
MERKTARITILMDPGKKQAFEARCHEQDLTPSQVMRNLIREFMEQHAGSPSPARSTASVAPRKAAPRRRA